MGGTGYSLPPPRGFHFAAEWADGIEITPKFRVLLPSMSESLERCGRKAASMRPRYGMQFDTP